MKDEKGKVIEEWVSTEEAHLIKRLPVGKYTLVETITPKGYQESSSTVEFEVKATGDIQNVTFYNIPVIDVPNAGKSIPIIVYVLSIIIIGSGIGLVFINTKNKTK